MIRQQPRALMTDASETAVVETVSVFHDPSEYEEKDATDSDVKIHLQITDHSLIGSFTPNEVKIESNYSGTLWVYGNDSEAPFRITWSGGSNTSSTRTASANVAQEQTPTIGWTDSPYSEDKFKRERQFAEECGAGMLEAINSFGTK